MSDRQPRQAPPTSAPLLAALTAILLGAVPGLLALAGIIGLGMARRAPGWAIALTAGALLFVPPLLAGAAARRYRGAFFGLALGAWSVVILLAMPVYFPGERQRAVASGLGLAGLGGQWDEVAQLVADQLPAEPEVSEPEVPEAAELEEPVVAGQLQVDDDQVEVLPYEGEGRRMSIPVVFEHDGREQETWMMLDTGATYTTLPYSVLAELGIRPGPADPTIRLHTANGEREARVVLVDRVWLGDLRLDGVAIATCDGCSSTDTVGLLGLNVSAVYNLSIDADHQHVTFSRRTSRDRTLDVKPFVDVDARISRYPGGRVEVEVALRNLGDRRVGRATAAIECGDRTWTVATEDIGPGEEATARRRLPEHEACERYQVGLHSASW